MWASREGHDLELRQSMKEMIAEDCLPTVAETGIWIAHHRVKDRF